jgi:predicted TIM-barrel fold metal-dependent hydrolase
VIKLSAKKGDREGCEQRADANQPSQQKFAQVVLADAVHDDKAADHEEQLDTERSKTLDERHGQVERFAVGKEIRVDAVEQMNREYHQYRESTQGMHGVVELAEKNCASSANGNLNKE